MFISFTLIVSVSTQHAVVLGWFLNWSWLQMHKCGYGNSCQVVMDADWMPQFQCKVELPYRVHNISRRQPAIKTQQRNIRLSSKDRQWMKLVFKSWQKFTSIPHMSFVLCFKAYTVCLAELVNLLFSGK